MHASREPEWICIQHWIIRVEEVIHVVERLTAIVGCQRGWACEWWVLCRRHRRWHAVRGWKVGVREGAGAGRVIARFFVVVVVRLLIILLLYTPISLGLQSPIPKSGKRGVSLPSWFM